MRFFNRRFITPPFCSKRYLTPGTELGQASNASRENLGSGRTPDFLSQKSGVRPPVIFWRVEVAKDRSFKTGAEQLRLRNDFCVRTYDPGVHTPVFAHQTMRNFGQKRLPDTEAQRKFDPILQAITRRLDLSIRDRK